MPARLPGLGHHRRPPGGEHVAATYGIASIGTLLIKAIGWTEVPHVHIGLDADGALEAARVCRKHLLVKCQDQVVSGEVVWQTIVLHTLLTNLPLEKGEKPMRLAERFEYPDAGHPAVQGPGPATCPPRPQPAPRVHPYEAVSPMSEPRDSLSAINAQEQERFVNDMTRYVKTHKDWKNLQPEAAVRAAMWVLVSDVTAFDHLREVWLAAGENGRNDTGDGGGDW